MKNKKTILPARKRVLFFFICFALILGTISGIIFYNHPSAQFHRAADQLFYEEMTASTLNMHYTLANPQEYGITEYRAILPCYDKERHEESLVVLQEQITFYKELDVSELSSADKHTRNLLLTYLETMYDLGQYPYHEDPLSPSSGMQAQLPILLAEYTFRCRRDVEDYLAILAQTGDYFASLLTFETEKKEAGLLTSASSLRDTAEQCRTILTAEALANEEHFLQITFRERLQDLCNADILSVEESYEYLRQNDQILTRIMLPAYETLADGLTALADPSVLPKGLASKPEGAKYYEALMKSETGSSRSISEIRQLLTAQLTEEYRLLGNALQSIDPLYLTESAAEKCNDLFPYDNCAEMLKDLRDRMSSLFPEFPDSDHVTPSIQVKEVTECLQDYCAPAFYLTPPLDDTLHNTIYINPKTTLTAVDLYTTLAHEGFPGHMYQSVYSNQLLSHRKGSPVEQLLWFGGYLEGWALYVEFMAYDRASEIMKESGYPDYAHLLQIEKHNRSTQLCLYSLLDVLIHHENIDYQGTAEILADFGITNSASVSNIYTYIVEEPANYPKYYLGYLEILLLKDACRTVWQEHYNEYAFHKFFLDYGPADFGTLYKLVTENTPS